MSAASGSELRGRVWVSGAGGFTGRYLMPALQRAGFDAVAAPALAAFDLRDAAAVEAEIARARPDYVIHLAAVSFVAHGRAADFYEVNTVGTEVLLQALARSGRALRKIVLASSANIYGNAQREPVTEDTPPAPLNHYAASKLAMEHLARIWYDRLPIVITRPFNYTGVGQTPQFLVPKLAQAFARRVPRLQLGNLEVVRDFSDVRMVVEAYCRILTSELVATEINICSGVGRALLWIVDTLRALSGHAPRIEVDPALVRAAELRRLIGSNERLVAAVGPLPHSDFEATLRWMYQGALTETTGSVE
jgi:nucleoside-diphosphate-sugar epimerase